MWMLLSESELGGVDFFVDFIVGDSKFKAGCEWASGG
jgi:hypothetical protein